MPISKQALLAAIDDARSNSYGTDEQSSLGVRRAKAIEAYLGLNTNPAPEGRSQVVDRTVYQTVHTILPSLVRIFASSSEEVCKFTPVGPEDEFGADQTTALINHVVQQLNPWEQICSDWLHDAALMPNAYAMAYWDESVRRVREMYQGQSQEQITLLMQDDDVTILGQTQVADKPEPLFDVEIERSENKGKVCIKVLPPEHCRVSADTPSWMLTDCSFFDYCEQKSIADLRDMVGGDINVPEDISDNEDADDTDEDDARDRFGEDRDIEGRTGVMRNVWVHMSWVRASAEDDGVARLYYVLRVGRNILHAEAVNCIPVSSLTAQPLPHRHPGMSIAETIIDVQDTKTAVKRGGLDNLYLANSGRYVVSTDVNLDDMLDSRPGGIVRLKRDGALPGEGHVQQLVHPLAFDSIINTMEYFDQEAQNRTGASRYFSGTDANAINKTASGTIALQNMAAMRVEHVARMMAPAVEQLFSIVHELVSKHESKPMVIKLRGQWQPIDPQAWRTKRDVRISVGVGAGNKESMMQQLQMILGAQMQLGPMLAGPQQIHATVVEQAKLAGFSNPAKFWIDPSQQPPQPPPPSPEQIKVQGQLQIEQFKAQQDAMKFQAEQQIEQQRMMMQAEVDKQREEMQARQKMLEAQTKAELEAMKAQQQHEMELVRLQFEKFKAELDAAVKLQIAGMTDQRAAMQQDAANQASMQQTQQAEGGVQKVIQAVQALQEALDAPTEIVRGPDGRAVGVRRGGKVRQINRGPDGRAIGVQ